MRIKGCEMASMEIYKRRGDVKGEAEIFIKPQNWLLL